MNDDGGVVRLDPACGSSTKSSALQGLDPFVTALCLAGQDGEDGSMRAEARIRGPFEPQGREEETGTATSAQIVGSHGGQGSGCQVLAATRGAAQRQVPQSASIYYLHTLGRYLPG